MSYLSLFRCYCAVAVLGFWGDSMLRAEDALPPSGGEGRHTKAANSLANLPLHFEANAGQTHPDAKFIARGRGFTIYLTRNEAVLALTQSERTAEEPKNGKARGKTRRSQGRTGKTIQNNLRMALVGGNPQPQISGMGQHPGVVSYFTGNESGHWRAGVPAYERVLYSEVYPGIDLVFYGSEGQLEYDFNLQPGANAASIALEFSGADNLALTDAGELIINIAGGYLRWKSPVAFQEIGGERRPVVCSFTLLASDKVGFALGSYDNSQPLTIDPLLVYSTYLGGSLKDLGQGIAVNRLGTAFVTGQADSLNFPTNRAFRGTNSGGADVFVARLNTNATAFHYSTYVGGSAADIGFGIAVDRDGNAYVAGRTESANFPTRNAFQASLSGGFYADAFVFKLDANGTNLIYSSYLGGNEVEEALGIAVDSGTNNAYIVGRTLSGSGFPKKSPFQNNAGNAASDGDGDAFVAKFNTSTSGGGSLVWASWHGNSHDDVGYAVAVDASSAVYITGETTWNFIDTPSFPLINPFQPAYGGEPSEAWVTKIDNASSPSVVWSSYLGGTNSDAGLGIALDASNNVYVCGSTSSTNFPMTNAAQPLNGGSVGGFATDDAFLVKIRANGSGISYGTYLGGVVGDEAHAVAVDAAGYAWLAGSAASDNFPSVNAPLQSGFGGGASDAFVALINPAASGPDSLLFSTYYGSRTLESAYGIALDTNGNCYITGEVGGTNGFAITAGVVQPNYGGGDRDAFVAKIFAAPFLKMVRSGTNHLATWPVIPSGFVPESRTNVQAGTWGNLPGAVTTNNGMNRLIVTNTGPRKFIRLRRP